MNKILLFTLFFCISLSLTAQVNLNTPPLLQRESYGQGSPYGQYKAEKIKPGPRDWAKVSKTYPFDIPLEDIARLAYNTSDLLKTNGKPLVLIFWLTTCGPCKLELQTLNANYEVWKKETDFRLIAVSTDFEENWNRIVERVATEKWKFEAYHDYNDEFRAHLPGGLNGLPQVFVFDKTGKIVYHHRRFIPGDEAELLAKIKEANL